MRSVAAVSGAKPPVWATISPRMTALTPRVKIIEGMRRYATPKPLTIRGRRLELWLPALIVILDQVTRRSSIGLSPTAHRPAGILDFTHMRNSGAAFGILNAADFPFKTMLISVIAAAALIGIGFYSAALASQQLIPASAWRSSAAARREISSTGLYAGSVVDFIDVYWRTTTSGPST